MHGPITANCSPQYAERRQGETTAHLVPPSQQLLPRDIGAQPDPQDLVQAPSSRRLDASRLPNIPFGGCLMLSTCAASVLCDSTGH